MRQYKITALAENTTYRHNCLAQHGQSMLIEVDEYKILFDVGEISGAVEYNLTHLDIEIDQINEIVISHRHIDHIGALLPMLPGLKHQRLYLPLQLGESHIKEHPEKYNFLKPNPDGGYDLAVSKEDVLKINEYKKVEMVGSEGFEIGHNIFTTGCVGDWMMEQAMVIDQQELGITVILGCSHPSTESLIEKAIEVTGNEKVRMVIGGMHYTDFNQDEIREKANGFRKMGVETIVPSHCTTIVGGRILKEELGNIVLLSKTGSFGAGNSLIVGEEIETRFV